MNFNPRSHERSDYEATQARALTANISIHAPTRGATSNHASTNMSDDFNPRSHERSDLPPNKNRLTHAYFNPRSHERSDLVIGVAITHYAFQSTLPREERPASLKSERQSISISIHAPTRGATSFKASVWLAPSHFNPRSHERSDVVCTVNQIQLRTFQSTLPREERHRPRTHSQPFYSISIHAPTRGATAILHKKFVYFYTIPTINI